MLTNFAERDNIRQYGMNTGCAKVKAAGLPTLRGPHNLRHTWATLALKAGVHPKIVSDRLGHATIAVTVDIYSHVTPSMDADAADLVAASIFSGGKAAK